MRQVRKDYSEETLVRPGPGKQVEVHGQDGCGWYTYADAAEDLAFDLGCATAPTLSPLFVDLIGLPSSPVNRRQLLDLGFEETSDEQDA